MFATSCKVSLALCSVCTALLLLGELSLAGCGDGGSVGGNGGGGSNPTPAILAIDPKSVVAGGPDFFLTVYGSGFVSASTVEWNGVKLPTTFVNNKQIFAQVGAANRSGSGTIPVTVFNPMPGGGTSSAASVFVNSSPPSPMGVGVFALVSIAADGS